MQVEDNEHVPNITSPTEMKPMGEWHTRIACYGKTHIFFPENDYTERGGEKAAKTICHTCPVVAECFEWGIESNDTSVIGGANRWERHWFRDPPSAEKMAEVEEIFEKHGRKEAQKIKTYVEEIGMPKETIEGQTTMQTSSIFGIPVATAKQWQDRVGVFVSSKKKSKNKKPTKT